MRKRPNPHPASFSGTKFALKSNMALLRLLILGVVCFGASNLLAADRICLKELARAAVVILGDDDASGEVSDREKIALRIVEEINRIRKPVEDEALEHRVQDSLKNRILKFIEEDAPIEFMLPAFPGKSPNHVTKVLGPGIDLTDKIAIQRLARLARNIKYIYAPGAKIMIAHDGRLFTGTWWNSDAIIESYLEELRAYNTTHGDEAIHFHTMDEHYSGTPDQIRAQFMRDWAPSEESVRQSIETNEERLRLYLALSRFIQDDIAPGDPIHALSGKQQKRALKDRAMGDMRINDAHGYMLKASFPNKIRLTVRFQGSDFNKIGVSLLQVRTNWGTPWHGVAVIEPDGSYGFMKRHEAESSGYRLVYLNGNPHHYVHDEDSVPALSQTFFGIFFSSRFLTPFSRYSAAAKP